MSAPYRDLDPENWDSVRALGHRMIDDMIDHLATVRQRPVWQPMPDAVRDSFQAATLPTTPTPLDVIYQEFQDRIQPFTAGNIHPRFMGWVHGGGNVVGMLADLLAGGLNANLGGRDHAPIAVERQIMRWCADLFGFPPDSTGILVTGSSLANLIGVLIARRQRLGATVRTAGLKDAPLVGYAATSAHGCIARAFDFAGLGTDALRRIACDGAGRMRLDLLDAEIAADRAAGLIPFIVIGTAGTVDTGAIDDLNALADRAAAHDLWFHVDGAFGAFAHLSPRLRPLVAGIERADSLAFDFHKWAQIPYDAGCVLVRDGVAHAETFAAPAAYLQRETRGLAAGHPWFCDFGPDLSRGFRALKVWFTLRAYGTDHLGRVIDHCCAMAHDLAARIDAAPHLERAAPVALNIVCFRHLGPARDLDAFNRTLVIALQESGVAVPSTTTIDGHLVIRIALVNHRVGPEDLDQLMAAVAHYGAVLTGTD